MKYVYVFIQKKYNILKILLFDYNPEAFFYTCILSIILLIYIYNFTIYYNVCLRFIIIHKHIYYYYLYVYLYPLKYLLSNKSLVLNKT